jgi:hypothetical protein
MAYSVHWLQVRTAHQNFFACRPIYGIANTGWRDLFVTPVISLILSNNLQALPDTTSVLYILRTTWLRSVHPEFVTD